MIRSPRRHAAPDRDQILLDAATVMGVELRRLRYVATRPAPRPDRRADAELDRHRHMHPVEPLARPLAGTPRLLADLQARAVAARPSSRVMPATSSSSPGHRCEMYDAANHLTTARTPASSSPVMTGSSISSAAASAMATSRHQDAVVTGTATASTRHFARRLDRLRRRARRPGSCPRSWPRRLATAHYVVLLPSSCAPWRVAARVGHGFDARPRRVTCTTSSPRPTSTASRPHRPARRRRRHRSAGSTRRRRRSLWRPPRPVWHGSSPPLHALRRLVRR